MIMKNIIKRLGGMFFNRGERGVTLVESIVAIALLGGGVLTLILTMSGGALAVNENERQAIAQGLARTQLEDVKNLPYDPGASTYPPVSAPDGYESGNAGVNAWGVENVYGLVVEAGFRPATTYVTTLPEGDFYRGLTRSQGVPFFQVKPTLALSELWRFVCYKQVVKSYRHWQTYASDEQIDAVVRKAALHLHEMDAMLREQGFRHVVFITPTRSQALGKADYDPRVRKALAEYGVDAIYLGDKLKELCLSNDEIRGLYVDECHLSKKGHRAWAGMMKLIFAENFPMDLR